MKAENEARNQIEEVTILIIKNKDAILSTKDFLETQVTRDVVQ